MFNIAQAALQNRSGNVQNYNVHANNVRGRASELLRESNYAAFPQRWKDLFEASRFAPASPERLGKLFLTALPADPQRAIPSSELNGDKDGQVETTNGTCVGDGDLFMTKADDNDPAAFNALADEASQGTIFVQLVRKQPDPITQTVKSGKVKIVTN